MTKKDLSFFIAGVIVTGFIAYLLLPDEKARITSLSPYFFLIVYQG